ncbi:hypothetical protein TNCV_2895231 [Trichonephila clavipes]|nr:hypothetical protein TNCV_2895231 [Trichonephila clavipes]
MPYERLRKMASSCASRSYTNAGRSVSSPKGITLKVDVLRGCELFRVRRKTTPLFSISSRNGDVPPFRLR